MFKYTIIEKTELGITAEIIVDSNDPIFEGHFPQKKVTPGACQSQLIIDVICEQFNLEAKDLAIKSIKFHKPHLPEESQKLNLSIEKKEKRGKQSFKAIISDDSLVYTSIVGSLK